MTREQATRKRDKIAARLCSPAGILGGSLLRRTVRHSSGWSKCARGEGHQLWGPGMRHADTALEDDALLLIIQQELAKRCKKSKTRGRKATPAEVVLRMLLLKHVRDWSYETLSREVRANLVYREFTRIGGEK